MGANVPHSLRWLIGSAAGVVVVAMCWNVSFLDRDWRDRAVAATVAVAILVGEALPDARRLLPEPGMVTGLIAVSAVAVYACVPETDHVPSIAVTLAGVAVIERAQGHTIPLLCHAIAAALVLWAGVYGAAGEQRGLIGTLFAFWTVIMPVVVVRFLPRVIGSAGWVRVGIGGLAGAAALTVARTGALQFGQRPAATAAALWGGASLVVAVIVALVAGSRPSNTTVTAARLPHRTH